MPKLRSNPERGRLVAGLNLEVSQFTKMTRRIDSRWQLAPEMLRCTVEQSPFGIDLDVGKDGDGIFVVEVLEGGLGARAGVCVDDRLVCVGSRAVASAADLQWLASLPKPFELVFERRR
eukprot:TRINITY_DN4058_c0_g1_i1.p1 TRINITY_DN4058_c0_g1~~TRINITY_DN4058_c0_g1_i1.p1  ORF type:complete len:119 (-),score=22.26 TRINITY_DN4058_c0_g1_i1:56-412(-)